jgi:hypothetical protein
MKLEFSLHIIQKFSNIKFYENPSSDMLHVDRQTDKTEGPKMSLKTASCEDVVRIHLAQDMAFVDTIMDLQFP